MYQINFISIEVKARTWTSNQKFMTIESAELFANSMRIPYYSIEKV